MTASLSLFPDPTPSPAGGEPTGLRHADDVLPADMQAQLIGRAPTLDFAPFDFRGFKGNRRTVSFGSRYDFTHGRIGPAAP
ncbi:MAG TPA: alpha-ketoglutarate-dependent dioxygenase AlkB, partial [Brevundimonas sp.]|nr:alpha-ketoglutarate-dependent dioxygenase AlkB [Brevundimonas sp.]